jgi:chromosome segregation ATPase
MKICNRFNLVLLVSSCCYFRAALAFSAVSQNPRPGRVLQHRLSVSIAPVDDHGAVVFGDEDEDTDSLLEIADSSASNLTDVPELDHDYDFDQLDQTLVDLKESKEVAHLQKKLRYWKQEQKYKEAAYKIYIQQQNIEQKLKPIYKREGKIDKYVLRRVYDHETEKIQTEIWTIKERIKLTYAKLQEELHVQQVQEETAQRLAEYDANIDSLKNQLVKAAKRLKLKDIFRAKAKSLKQELASAKKAQKQLREQAEAKVRKLEKEYALSMEELRQESSQRLSEKEQEIQTLAQEIQGLIGSLQKKRQELGLKEETLAFLETTLNEKEELLKTLQSERDSLRALARRSWHVLKGRVKKRFFGGSKKGKVVADSVDAEDDDNQVASADKELQLVRGR